LEVALPTVLRAEVRLLAASTVTVCGGDVSCRLELARQNAAEYLVVLYVDANRHSTAFELEVLSATTAFGHAGSVVYSVPRWRLPVVGSSSDDFASLRDWIARGVAGLAGRPNYGRRDDVRLVDVPPGATLQLDESTTVASGDAVVVEQLPKRPLQLRVAPPDAQPYELALPVDGGDVSLMTSARRVRQATFWLSAAATGVGTGILMGSLLRHSSRCVAMSADACASQAPAGASLSPSNAWIPLGTGLMSLGGPGLLAGAMTGKSEAPPWLGLVGLGLGLTVGSIAVALRMQE
jgi:hypothetical protein